MGIDVERHTVRTIPQGLGVGLPWQNYTGVNAASLDDTLTTLDPDWWYDWKFGQMGRGGYFPMLWACDRTTAAQRATFNQAVAAAQTDPERLWFLGNEPERSDQSNTTVHAFGAAAKEFRRRLPTTPIALPGVMVNDAGMYWLAGYHLLCQQGRAIVPDYIHVHIYADVWENWRDQLNRIRDWARDAGWPDLLLVTETAYGGPSEVSAAATAGNLAIMQRVKAALKVGDARAVAWMSSRWKDWPGPGSDLLKADGTLSTVGEAFVA